MTQADLVDNREQYGDSSKLEARARLHRKYAQTEAPWFSWIAGKAKLQSGSRVLDIGCGPGWFWAEAAESLPESLDIQLADLSPGMVDEAIARVRGIGRWAEVEGTVADVTELPFDDASFDAIFAVHMLYHASDRARAIAEIARVLKPGGVAIVTTNGRDDCASLYDLGYRAFGGKPGSPIAGLFDLEMGGPMLRAAFGEVEEFPFQSRLVCTDPKDVVAFLLSHPPGDGAPAEQQARLRELTEAAFEAAGGVFEIRKVVGLFLCRKG
ncbi:class I SAM-dependent methyltransferase [Devosia nitrariae]|nr:class I SAM-dependent methyltransferase [Devosia nitrariae]